MQKIVMDKNKLEEMWVHQNLSLVEIERRTGISVKTVRRNIREHKIERDIILYRQKEWLCQKHYVERLSLKKIAKLAGVSLVAIQRWMNFHNLKSDVQISNDSKKKYTENIYYFDKIDSQDKAYWLGFIMADGCVRKYILLISLSRQDRNHLQKFLDCTYSNRFIKDYETKLDTKKHPMSIIHFNSKHLTDTLRSIGFTNDKSLKEFIPEIDKQFLSHFIRGYFDGDGCFSFGTQKKGKKWHYTSLLGGENFLNKINIILNDLDIKCKFYHKKNGLYCLMISHHQSEKFMHYIYQDANIYLDRKFDKFQSFLIQKEEHLLKKSIKKQKRIR